MWRIDERTRPWWTLVGACFGLFILMLDSTVVALALPSIRHDVGASAAGLQWVMNGYLLVITAFVITAGRLGDQFGRKRLFLIGMALFALGSVVSATADGQLALILGRLAAGARRGADAAAFAGDRLQRLPGRRAGAGAGDLGRDLRHRAGHRPAGRRRPGRHRLAADLLDQPADRACRDRDRLARRAGVDRPGLGTPDRRPRPRRAGARADRGRPGAGPGRRLERRRRRRADRDRRARFSMPSGGSSTAPPSRSSTSRSSATAPTSAPAPPPSPWSAPTGR